MKPKEKAEYLVDEYYQLICESIANGKFEISKDCALIAVDELIRYSMSSYEFGGYIQSYTLEYWQEVKQELENV